MLSLKDPEIFAQEMQMVFRFLRDNYDLNGKAELGVEVIKFEGA